MNSLLIDEEDIGDRSNAKDLCRSDSGPPESDGIQKLESYRFAENKVFPSCSIEEKLSHPVPSTSRNAIAVDLKETPQKRVQPHSSEAVNSAEKRRQVENTSSIEKQHTVPLAVNENVTPVRELKQLNIISFFGKKK